MNEWGNIPSCCQTEPRALIDVCSLVQLFMLNKRGREKEHTGYEKERTAKLYGNRYWKTELRGLYNEFRRFYTDHYLRRNRIQQYIGSSFASYIKRKHIGGKSSMAVC